MRSITVQSVAEMGGRVSVLSRQKRDHVRLDSLLRRLGEAQPHEQGPVLLDIYRLVFPHAFAEESVLWPVIRRVVPDGEAITLRNELEHQKINELVTQMEALTTGSPEHQQVLDHLVELLGTDVRDEEDVLLPSLQAKLSPAQLRLLGVAWEAVRRIAPTRAHPVVARRPPGNVLSALPLSLLDRSRDRVDAFRYRRPHTAATPLLQALSSALTRASHAVEQLPGMRSGENPATRRNRKSPVSWGTAAVVAVAAASTLMVLSYNRRKVVEPRRADLT
jgi:hypothetical protein